MKNFKSLLLVSAAVLAFGACSSDEKIVLDPESPTGFDSEGNGYINISINLPTGGSGSTRANDNTDDGDANEYKVNDVTLLLFGNNDATETTATFQAAYDLNLKWNDDVDNDHITTQGYKTQKINDQSTKYKYAVVVINKNSLFTLDATNHTIKFGDDAFTGTFQQFSQQIVKSSTSSTTPEDLFKSSSSSDNSNSSFFMTNAVLAKQPGTSWTSGASTVTMADITNKIYKTETAAMNGDVVDIVVERGLAKVQLTTNFLSGENTTTSLSNVAVNGLSGESDYLTTKPADVSWALKNKNAVSYLVRNWNQTPYTAASNDNSNTFSNPYNQNLKIYGDGASTGENTGWLKLYSDGDPATTDATLDTSSPLNSNNSSNTKYNAYRFAGYSPVMITTTNSDGNFNTGTDPTYGTTPSYYYRTYWGVDPNYSDDLTGTSTGKVDETTYSPVSGTGAVDTKYCFENTFDLTHQTQKNTTEAMIKVAFTLPEGKNKTENGGEGNNTFYTLNGNSTTVYNIKDLTEVIAKSSAITGLDGYTEGTSKVTITYAASTATKSRGVSRATDGDNSSTTESTTTKTPNVSYSMDTDNSEAKGQIVIKSVVVEYNPSTTQAAVTSANKVNVSTRTDETSKTFTEDELKALNAQYTINRFYKGEAYYPVLIKHFGDDLTPWTESTKTSGQAYTVASSDDTKDGSGKSANDRWLGRYGVLRNNWYLLTISSISNIGYPDEPTPDTTTDDEVESWINVRVSMLSWAKRQQDIKL